MLSIYYFVTPILAKKQYTPHIVRLPAIVFDVVLQIIYKSFYLFAIPYIRSLIIGYFNGIISIKSKYPSKKGGACYNFFFLIFILRQFHLCMFIVRRYFLLLTTNVWFGVGWRTQIFALQLVPNRLLEIRYLLVFFLCL